MGYNTKVFDQEACYASMSLRRLESRLKSAEEFAKEFPEFEIGWHNEYIHMLKLHIAERIGRR